MMGRWGLSEPEDWRARGARDERIWVLRVLFGAEDAAWLG